MMGLRPPAAFTPLPQDEVRSRGWVRRSCTTAARTSQPHAWTGLYGSNRAMRGPSIVATATGSFFHASIRA
jgi:hypothetical protein